ncbi:phosphoribosyltransferase [Leptolyngbya sp. NIES-2104]|uniref:phosphoribosyltransferase n=1 Tax=Leptolyngbya sp. NIES-2104 TaxID=1552121 RepID=UPI0006ECBA5A|nr:phosphoribosyltransferase family protein [Leptolyngbya sp. NIES-2104]GAP95711.1 phosphoribosyltransferase [Leptolyngbya sp. NIES-2104]
MSSPQLSPDAILFDDRADAARQLAELVLKESQSVEASFVVYALPRGGIGIGAEIAQALGCPLDILVAKKITRPHDPELAIGAVTADGHILRSLNSKLPGWQEAVERAQSKAKQQLEQFHDRPNVTAAGKIALLVDDGIATGMTISVAAQALREQQPKEIWICAPVAPAVLVKRLYDYCDRVLVLAAPDPFLSVSRFYRAFPQVETESAIADLKKTLPNC